MQAVANTQNSTEIFVLGPLALLINLPTSLLAADSNELMDHGTRGHQRDKGPNILFIVSDDHVSQAVSADGRYAAMTILAQQETCQLNNKNQEIS